MSANHDISEAHMRRIPLLLALVAAAAAATTGLATAAPTPGKLALRHTNVGKILVDARGFTVYAFTRDGRNRDACIRISGCVGVWPVVTAGANPLAGPGVRSSLIGTIAIGGGRRQVTYAGHPLYTYVADSAPGETEYVGVSQFGGSWPALNAAGGEVR
jgi:predicted lipoprotein with Yx(FWY)xxD motif